jgi:hypothetical protein
MRSGRSAAWLARLVRDQEVEGSNPFAPTIISPLDSTIYAAFSTSGFASFLRTTSAILGGSTKPKPTVSACSPWTHTCFWELERETEIASDLRIEIREFRWAHQCSSGQQALACFQNKKKWRAVNLLRVAKLRSPHGCRNSSGGHKKGSFRRDVRGVAPEIRSDGPCHSSQ